VTEALKFLRPGRIGPFSQVAWPGPGEWLDADGAAELCRSGVHALLPEVLARWVAEELWRVEIDGGALLAHGIVVGPRGRLRSRVEEWNDQTAREFAHACAGHVSDARGGRAAEYAAEAAAAAESAVADSSATTVAYIAAHAAEARAPGSFDAERGWQSRWLAERLGVAPQDVPRRR
jgi:hypothetical protein